MLDRAPGELIESATMSSQRLGRPFAWLWAAYAASTAGTWLSFGAFPLIAIQVLHAGPAAVSALAAAGLAGGALLAAPLGPWLDGHGRRRVMIATDLLRFPVLLSVPLCHALGLLTYAQLVVVSVVGAAANIAFTSAGGAYLKHVVPPDRLLTANARLESTGWTAVAVGPVAGGAAISMLGPVVTVCANAAGFLLSALAIGAVRVPEARVRRQPGPRRAAGLIDGWRFINADRRLRALFRNTVSVNALIMATEPLLAVLLLHDLGWHAWQYGLAFGLPCTGGFLGAQIAGRLALRHGHRRVLTAAGVLRAVWPVWLVFVAPGTGGVLLVIAVEFVLITCIGVFNPLFATERLRRVPAERLGRVLVAWHATNTAAIAALTALWGVLAALVGARTAIGLAGVLLLATPLLLPRRDRVPAAGGIPSAHGDGSDGRRRPAEDLDDRVPR